MHYQNGRVFDDLAAKNGAPQTRAEVEAMIARAPHTDIAILVKRWLLLDDEVSQIREQANHVEHILGDRLLGMMLGERIADITATMRRRAMDVARLSAKVPEDVGTKCYVRSRIRDLAPDDAEAARKLCESIRRDVKTLRIPVHESYRERSN